MLRNLAELLEAVVGWAREDPAVRGVALVGSHAREAARPESDVDLVVLARRPEELVRDPAWVARFGEVGSIAEEDWGRVTSLRVFYRDGPEVEFGLTDPGWADAPPDEGTRRVVMDGLRLLYDPDGCYARLLLAVAP